RSYVDKLAVEHAGELPGNQPFDVGAARATAELGQGRHPPIRDSARNDQVEIAEVGCVVERKSVTGDPSGNADTDGREFLLPNPYAGQAGNPSSLDPVIPRHSNQHFLQIANVAMDVAAIGFQIDDRIPDDLTGTVIGDVATATGQIVEIGRAHV